MLHLQGGFAPPDPPLGLCPWTLLGVPQPDPRGPTQSNFLGPPLHVLGMLLLRLLLRLLLGMLLLRLCCCCDEGISAAKPLYGGSEEPDLAKVLAHRLRVLMEAIHARVRPEPSRPLFRP